MSGRGICRIGRLESFTGRSLMLRISTRIASQTGQTRIRRTLSSVSAVFAKALWLSNLFHCPTSFLSAHSRFSVGWLSISYTFQTSNIPSLTGPSSLTTSLCSVLGEQSLRPPSFSSAWTPSHGRLAFRPYARPQHRKPQGRPGFARMDHLARPHLSDRRDQGRHCQTRQKRLLAGLRARQRSRGAGRSPARR